MRPLKNTIAAHKSWLRRRKAINKLLHTANWKNANLLLKIDATSDDIFRWAFLKDTNDINRWSAVKYVSKDWLAQMAIKAEVDGGELWSRVVYGKVRRRSVFL